MVNEKNQGLSYYQKYFPEIGEEVYIADGAKVIGRVELKKGSSIFYNSVLRGDVNDITVGEYTNIQDNCTLHNADLYPCIVGDYVTVGHNAILHGCTVHSNCLIGMGAIILNDAQIGENCIIGAGTLVTEHKKIPPNSLVLGSPGKVIRSVTAEEIAAIKESAVNYYNLSQQYLFPK